MTTRVLTRARTELAKLIRKNHANDIGVPMTARKYVVSPHTYSNTITSVTKDNYIFQEY